MRITFNHSVDAAMVICRDVQYHATLEDNIEGVTLNVDIDAEGHVLGLEILGASEFFELIGKRGGGLSIPDCIEDVGGFDIEACFQIDE